MDNRTVTYVEGSEELVGYKVKIWKRDAFKIAGHSVFVPPNEEGHPIPRLWREMGADGRLEAFRRASSVPTWILGLGAYDPQCPAGHWRHTIGIEENEHTDLRALTERYKQPLHRQSFDACEWMCFEMSQAQFHGKDGDFCKKDPYKMLRTLGWRFHWRVGVHFDAYGPDCGFPYGTAGADARMEFWISVAKQTEECDVCPSREDCAKVQPFD